MRGGIDTPGQAAEDYQAAGGEIARQAFRHSHSVGRGVARADHGDTRLAERAHVAAHKEHQRRIVNLLELLRIGGTVERHNPSAGSTRARQLVTSQFQRAAGSQGLRRNCAYARRFKLRQSGPENRIRAAEMFH
jgi:hypothetical protein